MKHTIKIDGGKSIVITPNNDGAGVSFAFTVFGVSMGATVLTPDQCGALIVGIEVCNEKSLGIRCHGDACCAGQLPCPTPGFCRCGIVVAA